jgi:hypothetical protein
MSEPERTVDVGSQVVSGRSGPRSTSLRRSCGGRREPVPRPGSRRSTRALAVKPEITWIDGEAADALRAAQARVLRKVLTTIAARRTRNARRPTPLRNSK